MSKSFKGSYIKNKTNRTSQYPHNRPLTTGTLESHHCLSTSRHPRTLPQAQSNWRLRHCGIGRESAWLEGRCARVPRSRAPAHRRAAVTYLSIHQSSRPSIHRALPTVSSPRTTLTALIEGHSTRLVGLWATAGAGQQSSIVFVAFTKRSCVHNYSRYLADNKCFVKTKFIGTSVSMIITSLFNMYSSRLQYY